jgi:glycine C-acetyltransferase
MTFRGKPVLVWSLNNYLGLANHPDIRKGGCRSRRAWGMAYPMGARMMSGQTKYHEQLEERSANSCRRRTPSCSTTATKGA